MFKIKLKYILFPFAGCLFYICTFLLTPIFAESETTSDANSSEVPNTSEADRHDGKAGKLHIEWTPVMGVQGYYIQLKSKKTDSIIFEKRVDDTSVDIEIPPGEYMQRVGVINKFHKVSSFTEWADFTIVRMTTPIIREIQNGKIKIDEGVKIVNIFGDKFQKGAKVMLLSSGGGKTFDITPEYFSATMIQIKVDPREVPEGQYHVMVENPGEKRAQKENSVAVYMNKPPKSFEEGPAIAAADKNKFYWSNLIIGVPRFRKGDAWIGSGQILIFSGLAAGAGIESQHANNIAKTTSSSFNYQFYNNYLMYSLLSPSFTNTNLVFNLGLKNYLDTNISKDKFNWHKQNAIGFAGGALAIYLLHITDAFGLFDISLGLANSSTSVQPAFLNTAYIRSEDHLMGNSLELKVSFPIR